jgi:CRP/FNR family cyclic AMP-dependent transcriptional regulator
MQPFTKTFKAGTSLFHEKDHSRELYIVQEGSVLIYRKIGTRELVLARLEKGSVFGEMALIDGKPRSASARALADCTLILIDAETFLDRVQGIPSWFMSIIRTTSEKIRKANLRLQTVSADNLDSKAIIVLSLFFRRYAEPDPDSTQPSVEVARLKRELLPLLCLNHARLLRIIDFLQEGGFIALRNDRICLKGDPSLDEYAEFLRNLLHKVYDKRPPSMETLEAFCGAIGEKVSSVAEQDVHHDLNADGYWEIMQLAGLGETLKDATQSFKDFGLLSTRKSDERAGEGNPCQGSVFVLDMNVLRRWTGYFRFSSMVPKL